MIFLSLLFIVFFTDRVVEDLQELIDDALGNFTDDDLGVAPLAPTGPVNLLPSPSNEVGSTDWSLEVSLSVTIVLAIIILCFCCYKRFC